MFKKPSFLERLTGSLHVEEYEDELSREDESIHPGSQWGSEHVEREEVPQEGELPIDMYHTGDNIVIRALVAGVDPDDLDIAITRDMVTIRGSREEDQEAPDEDYHFRELYWGSFSRTIVLPEEVLIDQSTAKEKHGMLIITLPKVDKDRSTKLRVKAH
ncbi:Hsp20/alpha crystallin family protein [Patescibacteria group bacterium]|jgi:HSP20 family protein|nr:Hsp20/alpha crystallin family protein [Patescibacteria group bacterium]